MSSETVDIEIVQSVPSKSRGNMAPEQRYTAGGEEASPAQGAWYKSHAFLLMFIVGWVLFPVWWIAALWGIKRCHRLKRSERAAWIGSLILSSAGIILCLIFIIWYGADPEQAKSRLVIGYNSGGKTLILQGTTDTCGSYGASGTSYPCPVGYRLMLNSTNTTDPSNSSCCEWIPTCAKVTGPNGEAFSCPSGTRLLPSAAGSDVVSDQSCCEPETCGSYGASGTSYPCPVGYRLMLNSTNTTNPSNSSCCEWIPTCAKVTGPDGSAFNCPAGSRLRADTTGIGVVSRDTCCELDTCGSFGDTGNNYICPSGYKFLSAASDNTDPNDTTCCEWIPTCAKPTGPTGDAFSCPIETRLLASAASIYVISNQTCCEPETCGSYGASSISYPCPDGYRFMLNTINTTSPSNTTCCEWISTCAKVSGPTGEAFSCPNGTRLLASAASIDVISNQTCCEPETCGSYGASGTSYPCPDGYRLMPNSTNTTNPSNTTCCEWVPTCAKPTGPTGDAFSCPIGTRLLANVTTIGNQTCCENITACRNGESPLYNIQGGIDYCVPNNQASCGYGQGPSSNYPVTSHTTRDGFELVDTVTGCHQIDPTVGRCPAGFKSFFHANKIRCYPASIRCDQKGEFKYYLPVHDGDFDNPTLIGCAAPRDLSANRCPEVTKSFFSADGTLHCRLASTPCTAPYLRNVTRSMSQSNLIGCAATEIARGLETCPPMLHAFYHKAGTFVDCRGPDDSCPSGMLYVWRNKTVSGGTVLGCLSNDATNCPGSTRYVTTVFPQYCNDEVVN